MDSGASVRSSPGSGQSQRSCGADRSMVGAPDSCSCDAVALVVLVARLSGFFATCATSARVLVCDFQKAPWQNIGRHRSRDPLLPSCSAHRGDGRGRARDDLRRTCLEACLFVAAATVLFLAAHAAAQSESVGARMITSIQSGGFSARYLLL